MVEAEIESMHSVDVGVVVVVVVVKEVELVRGIGVSGVMVLLASEG